MARELAQVLKSTYKFDILEPQIANRMAYKYFLIYGQNVSEYSNKDIAAATIASLAE